jgi:predicted metal-dependent HD superfamily phosphohydrolase
MVIDLEDLRSRFHRSAAAAGARRASDGVFEDLVRRYSEHHRHYHTLTHVDACLTWLDCFRNLARRPEEVELALWFHDAVYAPDEHGNERQSAELARKQLGALGVDAAAATRVARHIEGTEHHSSAQGDSALVIDLDLAILGAPAKDYDRFEDQIRREYAQVPEPMFKAGRCHVLQGFLLRPAIYNLPQIREKLEAPARANLARRIAELSVR